jgi:hypothetical protein
LSAGADPELGEKGRLNSEGLQLKLEINGNLKQNTINLKA